jgi:hypothetical protein
VDGERRRVHRHQRVRFIARGEHRLAAEVDLEGGNAGDGADRGADLRRIVREGGDGVGHGDAGVGESFADDLHSVAGISGEADNTDFISRNSRWDDLIVFWVFEAAR